MKVWESRTIPLSAGEYELSYYLALSFGGNADWPANPPILRASVNNREIPNYDATTATVGEWTQVTVPFRVKRTGDVQIALCDTQTTYGGDDYALDDIAVTKVEASPINLCDSAGYDNAPSQRNGAFTDSRRGPQINAGDDPDSDKCVLNLTGSVGSAGDLWITLVDPPGDNAPAPTFNCPVVDADVLIKSFDNRKGSWHRDALRSRQARRASSSACMTTATPTR